MIYDDEIEGISESIRNHVFERDGYACWLCGETSTTVDIAHQIHASASKHPFPLFKANGTIDIPFLSHCDNLIPLCPTCHAEYDLAFPEWIMVPDSHTLNRYLEHEKSDYDHRLLVSQTSQDSLPRTFPSIDRNKVLYHPFILSTQFRLGRIMTEWPKNWQGDPTTVIHRAASHGLLDSNPIQPIRLGDRTFQRGVQPVYQSLIGDLIRLWARAAPRGRS
jgi:hypothetical protein